MLDLNHPQSRWILAASHEDAAILTLAKLMTLLPTPQRQQLLPRIARPITRLRRLNHEHFGASTFIDHAITDLEAGCRMIASLPSSESRLDGRGMCPVCNTPLTDLPDYFDMTYCRQCLDHIAHARQRLSSGDGFGTDAI